LAEDSIFRIHQREAEAMARLEQAQADAAAFREDLLKAEAEAVAFRDVAKREAAQAAKERAARVAAETQVSEATSLTRQVVGQLEATARERVEAQTQVTTLRHHLDRAEAERASTRTEAAVLRDAAAYERAQADAQREGRKAAEAAAQAARDEIATLTAGGRLRRAWMALRRQGLRHD
jgi:chromosome segregation ATPase